MDTVAYEDVEVPASTLKLSDLLWRPWYAKAWWTSAAVFWAAIAFVPGAAKATDDGFVFALSLFLHPFALILYLVGRHVWTGRKGESVGDDPNNAEDSRCATEQDICDDEEDFRLFRRDPHAYLYDPIDIRSLLNPANPANPANPSNPMNPINWR